MENTLEEKAEKVTKAKENENIKICTRERSIKEQNNIYTDILNALSKYKISRKKWEELKKEIDEKYDELRFSFD